MTAEAPEPTEEPTPEPEVEPQPEPEGETPDEGRLPDDHPVVKALAKANEEAKTLRLKVKEFEDANKSELEKLQEALDAEKAEKSSAAAEAAKLRAAVKFNLSEEDLELLDGVAADKIEERAERLASRLGNAPVVSPSPRQGGGSSAPDVDPKKLADSIMASDF